MSESFVTPWTVAHLVPLSTGFFGQGYWSGLPLPPPGDLPDPAIKTVSPALGDRFFTTERPGNSKKDCRGDKSLEVWKFNSVLYVHTSLILWAEYRTEDCSTLL